MRKISASRCLAALIVWSAAEVFVPFSAISQVTPTGSSPTTPAGPVTTAPADLSSAGGELEKVTVTGYLIPRVGEGPQPVFTLDRDFISKQADQTLNDVLARYPGGLSQQNAMTFTGASNSPASSAYGLRGLPANDTLVLVDGYRFPSYPIPLNSVFSFVDVNSIPLGAVDRIEILKDGGSATYGTDAVAGVINVITRGQLQRSCYH